MWGCRKILYTIEILRPTVGSIISIIVLLLIIVLFFDSDNYEDDYEFVLLI